MGSRACAKYASPIHAFGKRAFAVRPADHQIALEAFEQFVRDDFQRVIFEDADGALVLGERVIEGDLVLR